MKVPKIVFYFTVSLLCITRNILPASIDGTTSVEYLTTNQVFHNNEYARGYVTLNSGATILSDATAFFSINTPLKGGLDLRGTGTLSLEGDLYLDTNFTLSGSGVIRGNGKTIFLNGNLTIPDNSVIHINSNSVIDGQGHDLVFGRRGRIFVDTNITLTLRNMKIVQNYNDFSDPCVRLASFKSQLALSDVEFALSQDFLFPQGELFIHGDVTVTGTSAFIYQSTQHSFIASDSTFYFDKATTFSVIPATFTDCRFDQWPTYTSNCFVVMADQTSRLLFNEASLCSTPTGCRFAKGIVNFKNQCFVQSNSALDLPRTYIGANNQIASTGNLPACAAYSPDGNYLAVVNKQSNSLQIFDSTSLIQIGGDVITGSSPISLSWSNTSTQLAVVNSGDNTVKVFNFTGAATPTFSASTSTGLNPSCVAWSTYGRYIAVTNSESDTLQILKSDTLAQIGSYVITDNKPSFVTWSPGDQYLAVTNSTSNTLQIFYFDYVNDPVEVANHGTGFAPSSVSWAGNGLFLSVTNKNSNSLQIFSFDGNLTLTLVYTIPTNYEPISASWAPNAKYVGVVNSIADTMQIFSFNDVSKFDQVANNVAIGSRLNAIDFSPSNDFIAVVTNANFLQVFPFTGSSIGLPYSASTMTNANSVSFSPDGNFISVLNSSDTLLVYPFTGFSIGAPYTAATGLEASAASWSPAGNFIAVVNAGSSTLQVFPFTGSSIGIPYTAATAELGPNSVSWSPDGRFIAVTLSGKIQIFPFSGSSIGSPFEAFSGIVTMCSAWSPDGRYLAVGDADVETQSISIFQFNPSSGLSSKTSTWISDNPFNIKWSPDGREIVVGQNNKTLQMFSFNGSNKLVQTGITSIIGSNIAWSANNKFIATNGKDEQTLNVYSIKPIISNNNNVMTKATLDFPNSISWDYSNSYIAALNQNSNCIQIFQMINPDLLTKIVELSTYEISPRSIEWSPDDRFIAVPFYGDLRIYSFNGSSMELIDSVSKGVYTNSFISWDPDGKFLAMVNQSSNELKVFPFNNNILETPISVTTGASPLAVSFSPNGTFISVINNADNTLQIFPFNGISIATPYTVSTGAGPISVKFSSNGDFIAVVNSNDNSLRIFYFSGVSLPIQIGNDIKLGGDPKCVSWSPDNRFLAITNAGSNTLQVFSFNGTSTPVQVGNNVTTGSEPLSVVWGPLGNIIAVVAQYSRLLQIYSFDGCNTPSQFSADIDMYALEPNAIAFSHNGKYITGISVQSLQIFELNYTTNMLYQAISNGVVFGNSKLGSSYDATVNLLAGSNVLVDGLVNYDCVI